MIYLKTLLSIYFPQDEEKEVDTKENAEATATEAEKSSKKSGDENQPIKMENQTVVASQPQSEILNTDKDSKNNAKNDVSSTQPNSESDSVTPKTDSEKAAEGSSDNKENTEKNENATEGGDDAAKKEEEEPPKEEEEEDPEEKKRKSALQKRE